MSRMTPERLDALHVMFPSKPEHCNEFAEMVDEIDALIKERDEMRASIERLQVAIHESTLLIDDTGQCDCREDIMCRFCLFAQR